MEPTLPDDYVLLRKSRLIGMIFLAYSLALPLIALIIPEAELPPDSGFSPISWIMIILMPLELVLLYIFYRHFLKRSTKANFIGQTILLYTFGMIPSIYGFLIGFTDANLRTAGILLGLLFSLAGMFLAFTLSPRLLEITNGHQDET